ncbi:MAG: endo-1,4-beta-xylanase [Bacteroidota bacterium]|nr:endo-1,4-beta-xylanase [Bacteroidota bacterium]
MKYKKILLIICLFASSASFGQTTPIKPIADGNTKFLGSAWSSGQNLNFQNYWNQVTPENGGKWGSVERTRNVMNWSDMDASYALAKKYNMLFKAHTLIWGAQQPSWIAIKSFRMARKYFPKSKLILNEYSVINSSSTTQNYIKIIKLLQAENLIDGIGEQAHAFTTAGTSATTLKANLDALAATGLPIYLTEMDIDGATDLIQLKEMQRVFPVFWKHPSVMGITFWGFRVGLWRNDQKAYLINLNGTERPAMTWLKAYVNDTLTITKSIAISTSDGSAAIMSKGASLNMVANVLPANTTIPNVTWTVAPTTLASIDANGKLTAVANGKVTVTATAWDGSGIKGSMDINIYYQTTGLSDKSLTDQITIYPNPADNGNFTIKGIEGIKRIELINMLGEKVTGFGSLNQSSINIQVNVPEGIYILNLFDGKQFVSKKIVIN